MEQPATIGSSVIPIANKLHEIFATISGSNPLNVNLPQVAVVGSQSSGKSSVLEALVGRDFLPRGNDICTRCPLLLQLENCDVDARGEWGEFLHLSGKRFYDFAEIRNSIQAETQRQAGRNKGVCDKQICLKISSPNVLNITLVDLPGITKVPVGDQPGDIEARVRKLIMSYIKQEACIILAVSPANSDLATSDALQMAKEADPSGIRTIGVITKLDIMDRGTNALNFLQGKVVPLRLGYVGVVNRCQEDINKNRSIREALAHEEKFFYDNTIYNGLSQRCGIPQLAKKLNQILEQHILTVLPKLKSELKTHLLAVGKELQSYGDAMESKAEQGLTLLNILRRHSEAFTGMVEGKSHDMSTKELSGGARIQYIFQSIFVKSLEEVDPCYDVTDDDIRTAIQNTTGPRNALFVPELPFEVFVTKQIARLLDPSLQCLRLVYEELVKMGRSCEATEIGRFPVLQKRLDEVMRRLLDDGVKLAEKMISDIIDMEMDYINTAHPNFIGGNKAVELALQQLKSSENIIDVDRTSTSDNGPKSCVFLMEASNRAVPNQGSKTEPSNGMFAALGKNSYSLLHSSITKGSKTEPSNGDSSAWRWGISSIFRTQAAPLKKEANKSFSGSVHKEGPSLIHLSELPSNLKPLRTQTDSEAVEVRVMKLVLRSYYDIVRKNIEDLVPKAIMHFLVNNTKRGLLAIFIQKLYREGLYDDMLTEDDDVASKRKQSKELLQVLQAAVQTLEAIEADVRSRGSRSNSDSSSGMPRF